MSAETTDVGITANDRIKQLNDIDKDVTKLLHSAGLAVKALTGQLPTTAENPSGQPVPTDRWKESFTTVTSQYFLLLSSVDVRLRRHIYALEEANILPAEATNKELRGILGASSSLGNAADGSGSKTAGGYKGPVTGGGLGSLDVGWLNGRNDHVGKEMEAELWETAEKFIAGLRGNG